MWDSTQLPLSLCLPQEAFGMITHMVSKSIGFDPLLALSEVVQSAAPHSLLPRNLQ